MRKFLVPAVLALALVLPAQAVAKKPKHYTGTVAPSGTVGFKVTQKKHSKKKSVAGFNFAAIPVNCDEGPQTDPRFRELPGEAEQGQVQHRRLEQRHRRNTRDPRQPVGGNHPRRRQSADHPSGTGTNCDSGVLSWTAHRG